MNRVLIDMDLIVYRLGHACDNRYYEYMGERYEVKKTLDKMLKGQGIEDPDSVITRGTDPDEWSDVKESIISFVEDLVDDYSDYQGFLSGKSNFRYRYATIQPYKAGRAARPTHYDNIRQLLVDLYGAKVSDGMEADDAIGLAYQEGDTIASLDKDMDIIPGIHYNWDKDLLYTVSELDGHRSFFKQMLTGDSTDNILGLYGVGPKSKLVQNVEAMEEMEDMREYVYNEYCRRLGSYGDAFFAEHAMLLWILHSRPNPIISRDYWSPSAER